MVNIVYPFSLLASNHPISEVEEMERNDYEEEYKTP
jgi:hypothetical protein